jgi:uncharacterized protein YecE (DUF72 family)
MKLRSTADDMIGISNDAVGSRTKEASQTFLTLLEWQLAKILSFEVQDVECEVRHRGVGSAVLERLEARDPRGQQLGVGLVNVDQPLFSKSLKPAAHATSAVAYVRMHGRNYQDWFRKKAFQKGRYDYLYTAEELRPWVHRIKEMASRPTTKELYAITNNHNLGKAPANGGMIAAMLDGEKVPLPPTLFARYRNELEPFAVADVTDQLSLPTTTEANP